MAKKPYIVARDVLPPELLEALSKALDGRSAYVWIPSARVLSRMERDRYIFEQYGRGYSQEEIADEIFLSVRTVYDIVARERRRRRLEKRNSDEKS